MKSKRTVQKAGSKNAFHIFKTKMLINMNMINVLSIAIDRLKFIL